MALVSSKEARGGKATAGSAKFWTNRLAATDPPLEVSQTRIPEIPDQTEFLNRWFEFHQGYRIAKLPDGTEQRIAVIGEPFREVSPGFLPRTLDQLRAGVENNAQRPENRLRRRRLSSEEERPQEPQQSIDSALDSLLEEATLEETQPPVEQPAPQPVQAPSRIQAPSRRQPTAGEALLRRNQRMFARVFGTREDLQRDDYESPISTIFNRAYDLHRRAEENRAAGTTQPPSLDGLSARERREIEEQLLWGVLRESRNEQLEQEGIVWSYSPAPRREPTNPAQQDSQAAGSEASQTPHPHRAAASTSVSTVASSSNESPRRGMADVTRDIQRIQVELQRLRQASEALTGLRHSRAREETPQDTLDSQPDRPPPMTDEEMTKTLSCQVCYQQLADIAVLPCGHMVMCQWCADVVIPVKHSHLPVRPSKCPMCRKTVKQRFKIHV